MTSSIIPSNALPTYHCSTRLIFLACDFSPFLRYPNCDNLSYQYCLSITLADRWIFHVSTIVSIVPQGSLLCPVSLSSILFVLLLNLHAQLPAIMNKRGQLEERCAIFQLLFEIRLSFLSVPQGLFLPPPVLHPVNFITVAFSVVI